jgi:2',3'-cyclic-nucleotide 2'-phosphodiesterase (5'-nucleotidase family)
MRVVYDPARPPGQRVVSLTIGGEPVAASKRYTVALTDYVARGGDGYAMFVGAERVLTEEAGTLLATTMMAYIGAHSPVSPQVEGRLTAVSKAK